MSLILILDDDADNCDSMAELVRAHGHQAMCAYSGAQALNDLETGAARPDLIVLDLTMPHMSGWEFLGHLEALGARYSRIPVIIYTASFRQHISDADTVGTRKVVMILKPRPIEDVLQRLLSPPRRPDASCSAALH